MFTIKLAKLIDGEWVSYIYSGRFVTLSESGELKIFGLNGSNEDVVMYINGGEGNYSKAFIMNANGVTVDKFEVETSA